MLDEWISSYTVLGATSWFGHNFQVLVLILVGKWLDWRLSLSASWFSPWFLTSCYRNNRWSKLNILWIKHRFLMLFKACNILWLLDLQYAVKFLWWMDFQFEMIKRGLCLNFLPILPIFQYLSRAITWNWSPSFRKQDVADTIICYYIMYIICHFVMASSPSFSFANKPSFFFFFWWQHAQTQVIIMPIIAVTEVFLTMFQALF